MIMPSAAQIGQNVSIGNNVTIYPNVTIGDNCFIFDGAVIGRPPMSNGNTTRPLDDKNYQVVIGCSSIVGANCVLYAGITIGDRVLIGDLCSIREESCIANDVIIGRGVLVMYGATIGARTRVIDGAILTGNIQIEEDVFIGPGVNSVNDNDVYLKRFGLLPFEVKGPTIRRFALIGTGANLAADVEIGMGAIVAPNAMVTHDVAPWTIAVGIPAKSVGPVDPDHRRQILELFGLDSSE